MASAFIHQMALCESANVGAGTRVWAFAHILKGAVVGADCNICDHVFIENDVVIGDRVTIKSGVQLWDGVRIADDVFVGPNATFSNDKYPRSRQYQAKVEETHIGRGASIGAGAVILPGLRIGSRAMIGAGAVVTHDVPAKAIVSGNPARIVGYVDTKPHRTAPVASAAGVEQPAVEPTSVRGVTRHRLTLVEDLRGKPTAGEFDDQIPFVPKRYFMVFDVPGKDGRGEHAHRRCQQFLVCIRGSVTVMVDDGTTAEEIQLREPDNGLLVPALVWAVQFKYSSDAVLLVFASDHYDSADYVRDYDEFLSLVKR
jgi:acetyltransferase-like isoleucine patch superfamily enzyme